MERIIDRDFQNVREYLSRIKAINRNNLPKTVTILGAGISGLIAAYELKKLNYQVKILEASNRIGGRIWTYRFDGENGTAYGELGAMRLPFNHEFTHYYINEMGLQSQLKKFVTIFKNDECFVDIKGKVCRLKDAIKEIYPSYEFSKNRKFKSQYTERFASALKTIVDAMSPKEIRELFEADLNNHLLDELDYSLADFTLEVKDEEFSPNNVLPLLSKLRGRCENVLKTYMRHIILESSSDLYQISGGMNQLPDAIANHLKDDIRLNAEVTGISVEDDRVKITINGDEQLYSDTVLCTIPFSVMREMKLDGFSKEKLDVIHNLTYVGATKVLFYCKDRFWEKDKYQIKEGASVSDQAIRQLYYPLALQNNSSIQHEIPGVLLASYVIGEDSTYLAELSHQKQINLIKKSVSRFHPEIESEDMVQDVAVISWENHKWTRGCSGVMWLGRAKYDAEAVTKPEKKLYFAGEHCSMDNAWIEGAITSALSQVEEIVQLQTRTISLEPCSV